MTSEFSEPSRDLVGELHLSRPGARDLPTSRSNMVGFKLNTPGKYLHVCT